MIYRPFCLYMIQQFLQYLITEKRYSEHTVNAYRKDLEQFQAHIDEELTEAVIKRIKPVLVRSFMIDLVEQEVSAKSINRKRSSLSSFFKYMMKLGIAEANPAAQVKAPKIKQRLPVYIEEKGLSTLLTSEDIFEHNFSGQRDKLIIALTYACGLRRAELIGLKESDCNLHQGAIKVLGKRNKERIIPLHPELIAFIGQYLELKQQFLDQYSDELLVLDSGAKMYEKFVYRKVNYYLSAVTTRDKKSPHVLRHSFATHMLNNGADIYAIKEILGHANLSATQVYTHNTISKLKKSHSQAHPRG